MIHRCDDEAIKNFRDDGSPPIDRLPHDAVGLSECFVDVEQTAFSCGDGTATATVPVTFFELVASLRRRQQRMECQAGQEGSLRAQR